MSYHFPEKDIEAIKVLLDMPSSIAIITHHRPDGDAMGSSLALFNLFLIDGCTVNVVTPSDYPDFLHWLAGNEQVVSYDRAPQKAIQLIENADLIFCLDFNWMKRVEGLENSLRSSKGKKILIDHHLEPETAFDYTFSFPAACSTAELVYWFIIALEKESSINRAIAECLYCGIMTDTNSFRFESMKADTHRILAELMEAGAVNYRIHEAVYDSYSENRLRLLGYALKEKLVVLNEYNAAYIALSASELSMFNFKSGDAEGLVNYALSIHGIRVAALFTERDGIIKISFRSKGEFSVKELSSVHFEGGGHRNASGGKSNLGLEATVTKFKSVLDNYKKELTQGQADH